MRSTLSRGTATALLPTLGMLVLAGCGGGDSDSGSSPSTTTSSSTTIQNILRQIQDKATKIITGSKHKQ